MKSAVAWLGEVGEAVLDDMFVANGRGFGALESNLPPGHRTMEVIKKIQQDAIDHPPAPNPIILYESTNGKDKPS